MNVCVCVCVGKEKHTGKSEHFLKRGEDINANTLPLQGGCRKGCRTTKKKRDWKEALPCFCVH